VKKKWKPYSIILKLKDILNILLILYRTITNLYVEEEPVYILFI